MKKFFLTKQILSAAFIILSAAIFTWAQTSTSTKHNTRQEPVPEAVIPTPPSSDTTKYSYEFNQPKFLVKHIVIEHDTNGKGKITFERLNEDVPVEESLELSSAALLRVKSLWQSLDFLNSDTNYQASKNFAHLGTMRIGMQQGERKRVAEFNWTNNDSASELVNEYRRAADQAILVFDIAIARENQPLNAPKLMEVMESYIRRNALSDPHQLIPLLKDMSTDEHIPLMARNHALRIIKQIQKLGN